MKINPSEQGVSHIVNSGSVIFDNPPSDAICRTCPLTKADAEFQIYCNRLIAIGALVSVINIRLSVEGKLENSSLNKLKKIGLTEITGCAFLALVLPQLATVSQKRV